MTHSDRLPPQPAANDDVPWAVRYLLPIALLAVAVLLLTVAWLLTL